MQNFMDPSGQVFLTSACVVAWKEATFEQKAKKDDEKDTRAEGRALDNHDESDQEPAKAIQTQEF